VEKSICVDDSGWVSGLIQKYECGVYVEIVTIFVK